jgi:hypothetical protein
MNTLLIQRKLVTREPFTCTFTKKDGSTRHLIGRYEGGAIRNGMVQVHDLEKDAVRTVNLNTVRAFGLLKMKVQTSTEPTYAEAEALMQELF